jgi:serine/threonine-protein kinase
MPEPSFLEHLRQRKLFQWALAYAAGAFAVVEAVDVASGQFHWPEPVGRSVTLLAVLGFFVTLVLAWFHGGKGRQRLSGVEILVLAAVLAIGGAALATIAPGDGADTGSADGPGAAIRARDALRNSVAVLPFRSLSPDPNDAYFAEGLHEEIRSRIGRISGLIVTSSTSARLFRDSEVGIPRIADSLGVASVVEGTVRVAGDELWVSVALVDGATDEQVWSQDYERERNLENLLELQTDISREVVRAIRGEMRADDEARLVQVPPTRDEEAYRLYLEGARAAWDFSAQGSAQALAYLERAVERDSSFALAYVSMAKAQFYYDKDAALASALRAVELDESLEAAHAVLGTVYFRAFIDWIKAEEQFALVDAPRSNDPEVLITYAYLRSAQGRHEEAVAAVERAVQLDPLGVYTHSNAAFYTYVARRYDRAAELAERGIELGPLAEPHRILGMIHATAGRTGRGVEALERAKALRGSPGELAWLGYAYGMDGRIDDARRVLQELERQRGTEAVPAWLLAIVHAGMSEAQEMVAWFERSLADGDGFVESFIWVHPALDHLRNDPVFEGFVAGVAKPIGWLEGHDPLEHTRKDGD